MPRRTQFEIWEDTFSPLSNHLDAKAGMNGRMFETFGAELAHVLETQKVSPFCVWTVVEGDTGKWYVSQGFHLVNRIGYLISSKPFEPANPQHASRYAARDVVYG